MEFTTLQENFLTALHTAFRFISSKPQLTILSSFLLEITEQNEGILSATDLQLGMKIKFPVETKIPGKIALPAKMLTDVVNSCSPGQITCVLTEHRFSIKTNKIKANLQNSPADEYPVFPNPEGEAIQLPKAFFHQVDQLVTFSASKDESRPVLTGVYIQIGEILEAAATDGYRLALLQHQFSGAKQNKILFPARSISEIARLLETSKVDLVQFQFSEELKQAFFQFDNSEVIVRTLDGAFPNYQKIVPQSFSTTVHLDREEFEHQVKTALLFSKDISSVLKIELKETACIITSGSGTANEYEGQLEVSSKVTEPTQIAFNGRFVLDVLQRIKTKEVIFQMNDEMKPGVFSPEGDVNFQYVVMPFRLNG